MWTDTDSFAFYDLLRKGDGSPVWDETAQGWLIYDYDNVVAAQRDESVFGNVFPVSTNGTDLRL